MAKFFNLDIEKAQVKYQFRDKQNPFVDFDFSSRLNTDLLAGLKSAVRNNQGMLANQYLTYLFDMLDEALHEMAQSTPKSEKVTKATSRVGDKQNAASEDVSN